MPDAPGRHDALQAAAVRAQRPQRLLALAELGVEAPQRDEQHHVAGQPEQAEHAEARDHEVPLLQQPHLRGAGRGVHSD